jgi:hypothetical protein
VAGALGRAGVAPPALGGAAGGLAAAGCSTAGRDGSLAGSGRGVDGASRPGCPPRAASRRHFDGRGGAGAGLGMVGRVDGAGRASGAVVGLSAAVFGSAREEGVAGRPPWSPVRASAPEGWRAAGGATPPDGLAGVERVAGRAGGVAVGRPPEAEDPDGPMPGALPWPRGAAEVPVAEGAGRSPAGGRGTPGSRDGPAVAAGRSPERPGAPGSRGCWPVPVSRGSPGRAPGSRPEPAGPRRGASADPGGPGRPTPAAPGGGVAAALPAGALAGRPGAAGRVVAAGWPGVPGARGRSGVPAAPAPGGVVAPVPLRISPVPPGGRAPGRFTAPVGRRSLPACAGLLPAAGRSPGAPGTSPTVPALAAAGRSAPGPAGAGRSSAAGGGAPGGRASAPPEPSGVAAPPGGRAGGASGFAGAWRPQRRSGDRRAAGGGPVRTSHSSSMANGRRITSRLPSCGRSRSLSRWPSRTTIRPSYLVRSCCTSAARRVGTASTTTASTFGSGKVAQSVGVASTLTRSVWPRSVRSATAREASRDMRTT